MSKQLPPHPNLEQLKKQAKDLRKAHGSADADAAARIKGHLPRLADSSVQETLESDLSLQEAQHVIAREYGCKHWEMLQAVVEADLGTVTVVDDRGLQTLMRELDYKDLVRALKGVSEEARARFMTNMSARVRGWTASEVELLKGDSHELESARRRLLQLLAELAVAGQVDWPFGAEAPQGKSSAPDFSVPEDLLQQVGHSLDQLTPIDIADMWAGIAENARREGILSLEPVAEQTADPFVREAVMLAVDGTEPALIRDILETRRDRAILPQLETRGWIIIEGLMAILGGDHPAIVRHKVESCFLAEPSATESAAEPQPPTASELAARIGREDPDQMTFGELAALLADMASLARVEGIPAFEPLPAALAGRTGMASEMMRRGLEVLLTTRDMAEMMGLLKPMVEERVKALGMAHSMAIEGIMAVQAGKQPVDIGRIVREVAGATVEGEAS